MTIENLKKSWNVDNDVYTKNGFTVVLCECGTICVWFNDSIIDKPFSGLNQALYWCEGRMI